MTVLAPRRPSPSHRRAPLAAAAAVGLLLAGEGVSTATTTRTTTTTTNRHHCALPVFGPGPAYHPTIRPADFSRDVTNPWFPLPVGRTYVYTGVEEGTRSVDIVVPSRRTRVVGGVRARVAEDRLYLDGVLAERTSDYYAQDRD